MFESLKTVPIAVVLMAISMTGCADSSKTLKCPVCNIKPINSRIVSLGTRLECANGHSWLLNAPTKAANR